MIDLNTFSQNHAARTGRDDRRASETRIRRIIYNGAWTSLDHQMDADWRFVQIRRNNLVRMAH